MEAAPVTPDPEPIAVAPTPTPQPVNRRSPNVKLAGDGEKVVLISGGKRITLPGRVRAGTYNVKADFGSGLTAAGRVTVPSGKTITVHCDGRFALCKIK